MEHAKINMDSLVTVLASLERKGFTTQFEVTSIGLRSLDSQKEFQPGQVKIVHFYRFEGESDPDDSSILYALETSDKEKGTLVDGYGISADSRTGAFMKNVENL